MPNTVAPVPSSHAPTRTLLPSRVRVFAAVAIVAEAHPRNRTLHGEDRLRVVFHPRSRLMLRTVAAACRRQGRTDGCEGDEHMARFVRVTRGLLIVRSIAAQRTHVPSGVALLLYHTYMVSNIANKSHGTGCGETRRAAQWNSDCVSVLLPSKIRIK